MRFPTKSLVTAGLVALVVATSNPALAKSAKTSFHCVDASGNVVSGVLKKKECSAPNKWVRAEPKSPKSASAQAVGTRTTK